MGYAACGADELHDFCAVADGVCRGCGDGLCVYGCDDDEECECCECFFHVCVVLGFFCCQCLFLFFLFPNFIPVYMLRFPKMLFVVSCGLWLL